MKLKDFRAIVDAGPSPFYLQYPSFFGKEIWYIKAWEVSNNASKRVFDTCEFTLEPNNISYVAIGGTPVSSYGLNELINVPAAEFLSEEDFKPFSAELIRRLNTTSFFVDFQTGTRLSCDNFGLAIPRMPQIKLTKEETDRIKAALD